VAAPPSKGRPEEAPNTAIEFLDVDSIGRSADVYHNRFRCSHHNLGRLKASIRKIQPHDLETRRIVVSHQVETIAVNIEIARVIGDVNDLAPRCGGAVNVGKFSGIQRDLILHAMRVDRDDVLRSDRQDDEWEVALAHGNRRRQAIAEYWGILVGIVAQMMEISTTVQIVGGTRLVRTELA
jgi:hypothetical protein